MRSLERTPFARVGELLAAFTAARSQVSFELRLIDGGFPSPPGTDDEFIHVSAHQLVPYFDVAFFPHFAGVSSIS
jgi:hypothetical protein